jgi:hypothetical protein
MILKRLKNLLLLLLLIPSILLATHTGNRYFLFLEKPENYVTKSRSFIDVSAFYSVASTAYKRYGGTCGVPELYGFYNLKDVITSLQQVKPDSDPIYEVTGSHYLDGKDLPFHVTGKINTVGLIVSYEQNLRKSDFLNMTCGVWVPVMNSDVISRFEFGKNGFQSNYRPLSDFEVSQIDEIRRLTHKEIGFKGTNKSRRGFGDIDVHLRGNLYLDHVLMMRSIDVNLQGGVVIPSGEKMDDAYPATVPFMNDGHWGLYLDFIPELELKQDLKLGLILGGLFQFSDTQVRRLAVGKEPTIYSAVSGKVEVDPGTTFKFSPYLTLENLTDGVHIQLRYTYLRHSMDKWTDKRDCMSPLSYLDTTPHAGLTQGELQSNLCFKRQISKWRAHYFTIQAIYDSKVALKNWFMEPKIYATYDLPINGNGFSKTHQITIGAQFFF